MADQPTPTGTGAGNLSREDLNRVAEQVARILDLQKLEDLSAETALFGRSTRSNVCSTKSNACDIGTATLTAGQ